MIVIVYVYVYTGCFRNKIGAAEGASSPSLSSESQWAVLRIRVMRLHTLAYMFPLLI